MKVERTGACSQDTFVKLAACADEEIFDRTFSHINFAGEGDGSLNGIDFNQPELELAWGDFLECGFFFACA
jgi:hypothetical protein